LGGHHSWWLAGLAGAAVSAVWNYAMSSIFTWSPRPSASPAPQAVARAAALLPR
jgi:putative flippase GtrA